MKISEIISLLAAIIALITAFIGLVNTRTNTTEIRRHSSEIKVLKVALNLEITTPSEGSVITDDVYDLMEGTFSGQLPQNYKLWVLARERHNYFLMYPLTQFIRTMGRWNQTNVRLGTSGRWELHVCLANEEASAWFEARAARRDWRGFASLPKGTETVRYVVVEKR